MADGEWSMADGEWSMADGEWSMVDGGARAAGVGDPRGADAAAARHQAYARSTQGADVPRQRRTPAPSEGVAQWRARGGRPQLRRRQRERQPGDRRLDLR